LTTRMFTSPLFLGFDHLEQMLERASKTSSDGYPPYNIEQISSTGLRISLAVAGFTMDDLQITQEDNQLVIRGRQTDDSQGRIFLHRGIAARQFQRSFVWPRGSRLRVRGWIMGCCTLIWPSRSQRCGSRPYRSRGTPRGALYAQTGPSWLPWWRAKPSVEAAGAYGLAEIQISTAL